MYNIIKTMFNVIIHGATGALQNMPNTVHILGTRKIDVGSPTPWFHALNGEFVGEKDLATSDRGTNTESKL